MAFQVFDFPISEQLLANFDIVAEEFTDRGVTVVDTTCHHSLY